eukprot:Polyplicarium_translucidae@DN3064_c0_g3_i3.p3
MCFSSRGAVHDSVPTACIRRPLATEAARTVQDCSEPPKLWSSASGRPTHLMHLCRMHQAGSPPPCTTIAAMGRVRQCPLTDIRDDFSFEYEMFETEEIWSTLDAHLLWTYRITSVTAEW